jgi:tetratricopeptide (TPR) repeat protein
MAFGFGFNKQKVLSAAEKFVQQGKLQNAIAEYEKVLKADPKDLTVSNTVGDLYARLGDNDKAIEAFKSVGDAYAAQGFTVKAIAMYKKLTKIKSTLESVLRLAELYTQQGLFNDARAQYLQVAEEFLRAGELEQAVRIFQKTLEMDPENVAMRMRLAEVYIRLNKKTEAWQIFASAAESLRARGSLGPAEEILQRMLTLDPGNSYALLLRARNSFDSGDIPGAIQNLEKVADLDSHPDGLRLLLQGYLQTGRYPDAGNIATKLFTVHNDSSAILGYVDALTANGSYEDALAVYQQYSDRLFSTDSAKVLESLHGIIGHVRENTAALETLLDLFNKAGETTHITEVYELLAHAYVQSGELEKARDYYLKLTQLEPQNQLHANNYQQVVSKLGGGVVTSRLITAEEGAVLVDELEATAPFIDQRYSDEIALAVRAALTDAELFVSYNMPAKALGPLLSALPKAPQDLRLNQRLAALHTRAGRFAEAAVCCRTLESIYHDAGHPDEASRYGELAAKYEERAAASPAPVIAETLPPIPEFSEQEFSVDVEAEAAPPIAIVDEASAAPPAEQPAVFFHAAQTPAATKAAEPAEFEVASTPAEGEIDLSSEWDGAPAEEVAIVEEPVTKAQPAPVELVPAHEGIQHDNSQEVADTVEEIRFYLAHSMVDQARDAMGKLQKLTKDLATLSTIRQEIEAAAQGPAPVEPEVVEEVTVEEPAPTPALAREPEPEPAPAPEPAAVPEPTPGVLDEFVSDLESSLGDGFLPETTVHPPVQAPAPEPEPAAAAYAEATAEPAHALGEFVADLEASLGDTFLPEAPVPQPEPVQQPVVKAKPAPKAPPIPTPSFAAAPAMAAAAAAPALEPAMPPAAAPMFTYQPSKVRPLAPAAAAATPKFDSGAGVDLADMFGELKHELEEETTTGTDEDPETHYNLGVAFREMGLLDEAIGELQKVCQSAERGTPFPQIMQTYTWLAQCFLDKGVPEAAIRWYEQALKLPDLDQETCMALHYELGSSYESAGNKSSALQHFMEVYGSNIDYRDVAERIKALKS